MQALIIIFVAHGLFILSVLDIYFKSTIHIGLETVAVPNVFCPSIQGNVECITTSDSETQVDRLVLFVLDGLPAQYLYEVDDHEVSNVPFIRSLVEEEGSWGLSYTRVPTESRPGHVALIAGLYEDPSAIFMGWKDNPISFDSVFNESDLTIGFGCEDILNLFEKRTRDGHMLSFKYPSNWQDYSGKEGTAEMLDNWVEDKLTSLLKTSKLNETFINLLQRPKTVWFFHLLGIDVAGHAYKPKTELYINALKNADKVVEKITKTLVKFFKNSRTTFLLTSDHGMTNWGSHGAGSPIETLTPIVAWGAGIKKPDFSGGISKNRIIQLNGKSISNPYSWRLNNIRRYDMNQADIAVLMSVLLKVPIPVNSVGLLPIDILDMPPSQSSIAYYTNALQLLRQFEATEQGIKKNLIFGFFIPFEPFPTNLQLMKSVERSLASQDYLKANADCERIIERCLLGMEYYNNYYRRILLSHLVLGIISVVMVVIGKIVDAWNVFDMEDVGIYPRSRTYGMATYMALIFTSVLLLSLSVIIGVLPHHYLVYFVISFLLFVWGVVDNPSLFAIIRLLFNNFWQKMSYFLFLLQFLVFTFFERYVLCFAMIALAFWPYLDVESYRFTRTDKRFWGFLCILLSIYPLLPIVENKENILFKLSAAIYWVLHLMKLLKNSSQYNDSGVIKILIYIANGIAINFICLKLNFTHGYSILAIHQLASWLFLVILFITLMFGNTNPERRFSTISCGVGLSFSLFTLSYDSFFLIFFTNILAMWIKFEKQIMDYEDVAIFYSHRFFSIRDVFRSYIYLLFVFVAFFGIGNLSSINSFNTDWVKGFVTTFEPFKIMGLIIYRTVLPIFLVTCAFRFTLVNVNARPRKLFYIVLLLCDTIAVELLMAIQNVGSWLEIGTSLTRFIIMEFIVLFLILLYHFAEKIAHNIIPNRMVHFNED